VIETHVYNKIYVFSPSPSRMLGDGTHALQVEYILLNKGEYTCSYAVIDAPWNNLMFSAQRWANNLSWCDIFKNRSSVKYNGTEIPSVSLCARLLTHRTNSTLPERILLFPMSPTYCFPKVISTKISRESSRWARWRLPWCRLLWWHGIVIVSGVCHVPLLWN